MAFMMGVFVGTMDSTPFTVPEKSIAIVEIAMNKLESSILHLLKHPHFY